MTHPRAGRARPLRTSVTLAALALAAVALLPGRATARQAAGGAVTPSLRVAGMSPLTVRGTHFKAGEHVTLTLTGSARRSARKTASAAGTFTARFAGVKVTRCTTYSVRAVGSRGSVTVFKAKPGVACRPKVVVDFGQGAIVQGTNFMPRERVKITITSADEKLTGTATVNTAGSFKTDLGSTALSNCSAYTVQVVGSQGSKVTSHHAAIPC